MNTLDRLQSSLAEAGWKIADTGGSWSASQFILEDSHDDRHFVVLPVSSEVGRETVSFGIHGAVDVCIHMLAVDVMRLMKGATDVLLSAWEVEADVVKAQE